MIYDISNLLSKLRLLESAIPNPVMSDANFLGIRVDEIGAKYYIRQTFSNEQSQNQQNVCNFFEQDTIFLNAAKRAGLKPGDSRQSVAKLLSSGLLTGDAVYAGPTTQHIRQDTREINGLGRLGWYFFLNDQLSSITSYHVACPQFNKTSLFFTGIFSYGARKDGSDDLLVGRLCAFDRIEERGWPLFDFALVQILDPKQADNLCRNLPYPQRLFAEPAIEEVDEFHILGLSDVRKSLLFNGVGLCRIPDFGLKHDPIFHEQLFFGPAKNSPDSLKDTQPGDSGSVIVHSRTNSIVGLAMAIDDEFTIANPIYRKPWRYCGSRAVSGFMVPCFETR